MLSALPLLIFRWGHSVFFLEIPAEIFRIVKTELVGYLRNVELAFAQILGRAFKPQNPDELDGSLFGELENLLVEMHTAHTQGAAQFFDAEVAAGYVFLDIFLRLVYELLVERGDLYRLRLGVDGGAARRLAFGDVSCGTSL